MCALLLAYMELNRKKDPCTEELLKMQWIDCFFKTIIAIKLAEDSVEDNLNFSLGFNSIADDVTITSANDSSKPRKAKSAFIWLLLPVSVDFKTSIYNYVYSSGRACMAWLCRQSKRKPGHYKGFLFLIMELAETMQIGTTNLPVYQAFMFTSCLLSYSKLAIKTLKDVFLVKATNCPRSNTDSNMALQI